MDLTETSVRQWRIGSWWLDWYSSDLQDIQNSRESWIPSPYISIAGYFGVSWSASIARLTMWWRAVTTLTLCTWTTLFCLPERRSCEAFVRTAASLHAGLQQFNTSPRSVATHLHFSTTVWIDRQQSNTSICLLAVTRNLYNNNTKLVF